jgi:hypothetical protein
MAYYHHRHQHRHRHRQKRGPGVLQRMRAGEVLMRTFTSQGARWSLDSGPVETWLAERVIRHPNVCGEGSLLSDDYALHQTYRYVGYRGRGSNDVRR